MISFVRFAKSRPKRQAVSYINAPEQRRLALWGVLCRGGPRQRRRTTAGARSRGRLAASGGELLVLLVAIAAAVLAFIAALISSEGGVMSRFL